VRGALIISAWRFFPPGDFSGMIISAWRFFPPGDFSGM